MTRTETDHPDAAARTAAAGTATSPDSTPEDLTMYTLHFSDEACRNTREVGGKAASLAEMASHELPVSPGFAVTASAYREYLEQDGLGDFIREAFEEMKNEKNPGGYRKLADRIKERTSATKVPDDVAESIRSAYAQLCEECGTEDVAVAVRSSATAEDSVDDSFAGEFETWVDIQGAEDVIAHVHRCYVSVFASRVLSYLADKQIDPDEIEMAVVVQKTVRARSAGVMFTVSPTNGDRSKIAVEASWGLGLAVVGGEVTPDRFLVDKIELEILTHIPGYKHLEYRRGDAPQEVEEGRREQLCLQDPEIAALAEYGKRLEKIHGSSQDIEFAVDEELPDGQNVVLLQCRPETVWSHAERETAFDPEENMMSWITSSISGE